jgi:nitroreductase
MENFLDLVQNRQSVRKYDNKPVDRTIIDRCIEAARLAPSACNSQPWRFIIVDQPELKSQIAKLTKASVLGMNLFVDEAPVLVVLVTEASNFTAKLGSVIKDKPYNLIDTGIAAEHFCLQATSEGLGTCMMGWFDEKGIKKILGIPKTKRAYLVISLGYPSHEEKLRKKVRKPTDDIASYNGYGIF